MSTVKYGKKLNFMELFERIRYLSEIEEVSLTKIAKKLGVPQQTFNQWLKLGSQKNLWEHLPKILVFFPDVRPEWLYMGQEPMLKENEAQKTAMLEARVDALENEVKRLRSKIFAEGAGDKDAATATGKAIGQE